MRAAQIVDWFVKPQRPSFVRRIAQRVIERFEDPAAVLIPRYLGLRMRDDTVFNSLGDFRFNVQDVQDDLSDGLVISAEVAAREDLHKTAALHILSIPPGGLPLFAEGFSMLMHRVNKLSNLNERETSSDRLPGQEEIERLKHLRRTLLRWAPFLNLNSPTVTFRSNDVASPKENEGSVNPNVADGWIKIGRARINPPN